MPFFVPQAQLDAYQNQIERLLALVEKLSVRPATVSVASTPAVEIPAFIAPRVEPAAPIAPPELSPDVLTACNVFGYGRSGVAANMERARTLKALEYPDEQIIAQLKSGKPQK